jgi:hypothetical protein
MNCESKNWRVIRRIGIGDREHVRSQLLSIGCFQRRHLIQTVEAAYRAGAELGMMARVHINAGREPPAIMKELVSLVHRFMVHDAQLIEHGFLDRQSFDELFETCDLIIQPKGEPNLNVDAYIDELVDLIKAAWHSNGCRFLGGNFARLSASELKQIYPSLFPDPESFYESFTQCPNS